jgi:hypothetical protein
LIEYEELAGSAIDYFGSSSVFLVTITEPKNHLREILPHLRDNNITHYFFDPRTSTDEKWRWFVQTVGLGIALEWLGVIPICRITDVPVRKWRYKVSLITARHGLCVTLMSPRSCGRYFPHDRVLGPAPLPISSKTLTFLEELRRNSSESSRSPVILFTGSLYEPRITYIKLLQEKLLGYGLHLSVVSRELGQPRGPNRDYWERLANCDIAFTTADQLSGPGIDKFCDSHLVYRYTEALAAGAALVAPPVLDAERLYKPQNDYLACLDPTDAANKIASLSADIEFRRAVAKNGFNRVRKLAQEHFFWNEIDVKLGSAGFVRGDPITRR